MASSIQETPFVKQLAANGMYTGSFPNHGFPLLCFGSAQRTESSTKIKPQWKMDIHSVVLE